MLINGSNKLIVAHASSSSPFSQHNFRQYLGGVNFLDETAVPPAVINPFIIFPFHYIALPVLVAFVCILAIASQFLHRIPVFDAIFQAKLIPPVPTLLPEYVLPQFLLDYFNEVTALSFGELFVIFCYFGISAIWVVVSCLNGKLNLILTNLSIQHMLLIQILGVFLVDCLDL